MKRVLFIDRDGTLVVEPPVDKQVDSLEKLEFVPKVFQSLAYVATRLDFEWVMVTNQDGMGTSSFPAENFWTVQRKIIQAFANEGIRFDEVCIDSSFPEENLPTRKPGTAMLSRYQSGEYDLEHSYVIGDRMTDVQLAANLGCKAIYFALPERGVAELDAEGLSSVCEAVTDDWWKIAEILCAGTRRVTIDRRTSETDICVTLNLDGTGRTEVHTGLGFFDHMLPVRTACRSRFVCVRDWGFAGGRTSYDRGYGDSFGRGFCSGVGRQTGYGSVWFFFAYGRLLMQGRSRFRGKAVVGVECNFPP